MAEKLAPKDDDHALAIQQFEEFDDGTRTARELWEKCRDYRDGNQWTEEERKALKARKQPIITDNKIQDKCDTLLGIEKQMRTDPKAYPRNPSDEDEQSAEAATDALRFIADQSNFKLKARKGAADNLMVEGVCFGQVVVENYGNERKICMERIRQDRGYYDIRSLEDDFSDKRYCGYFTWMDEAEVLEEFKDAKDILDSAQDGAWTGEQHDDKPRYILSSGSRKRVQVFTHFYIKAGKWMEGTWVRGGWLSKPKPCAYKDERGKPSCPLEIQALYRDSDGHPYGVVQRYLDLQDEHNKRRSKMLHLLNAKRIVTRKGALDDEDGSINKARAELHKPDGVIEVNGPPDDVRIEDNLAEAEGQWRLLQQTDMALAATGPNAALAGASGDISGIAKARDQQAGQLPISPLFDALDSWEMRMYRQAWLRVRQFWTSEMWVRVTDNEDVPRWVGLNQPVTQGEQAAKALAQDPAFQALPPEQKMERVQQLAQAQESQRQAVDDRTGKLMKRNVPAEMDVDIIIDRGPDVATLQQEEFQTMAELAKTRPEVSFKTILKLSGVRQQLKKEVLDELEKGMNPMAVQQAMQQVQQQAEMLQKAEQQLQQQAQEIESQKAEAEKAKAEAQAEIARIETERAQFEAYIAQQQANLAKDAVKLDHKALQFDGKQLDAERSQLEQDRAGAETDKAGTESVVAGLAQAVEGIQQQIQAVSQIASQSAAKPSTRRAVKLTRGKDGFVGEMIELGEDGSEVGRKSVALNRDGGGYTATMQ